MEPEEYPDVVEVPEVFECLLEIRTFEERNDTDGFFHSRSRLARCAILSLEGRPYHADGYKQQFMLSHTPKIQGNGRDIEHQDVLPHSLGP